MKTIEVKRGHGYYKGKMSESDTVGTIDTGMQHQHTLVGVYEDRLLIKNATKQGYLEAQEGDGIGLTAATRSGHRGTVQKDKVQTIFGGGQGTVEKNDKQLRIRKLTPKECFRLMGVKDEDFEKISYMSDSTLYHLAGDSIVVNVLMAIFKEML